jgi:CHASE2 domain-containing sensor protein
MAETSWLPFLPFRRSSVVRQDRPVYFAIARCPFSLLAVPADPMGLSIVHRKPEIVAAVATVLVGWLLVLPRHTPNPLVRWSYDLLQLALPEHTHTNLAIIYMDEQAMQDYGQKPGQWDRGIHARLLDRLSQDGPEVVVFDVMPTQAGDPLVDDKLARAIARNGRVVIGGDRVSTTGYKGNTIIPPLEQFETNAAAWGIPKVRLDPDRVVRQNDAGDDQMPDLAWAAASVVGAPLTRDPQRRLEERWLNYYGSGRPFEKSSMTYTNAESSEPRFFRGKAVFIGGQPETLSRGDITDVFSTPFTKWNSLFIPGVDLTAIAFSNLMRTQWLIRTKFFPEMGLLLVTGMICGFGFQKVRMRPAAWLSLLTIPLVAGAAIAVLLSSRIWFPWIVVCVAQVPCALIMRAFTRREAIPVAWLKADQTLTAPVRTEPQTVQDGRPEIADHALIRCIGEGAYGQVWIARNAIGLYHAVKVVYRNRFGTEEPYDRALRGIQKFMPISRSHEGFVHILHVGRNDRVGFFFYIMEVGDDEKAGQQIDPATYAPKTLAGELRSRGTIPARECLAFMLAVTEAVERLHQHQLIHRDIKPDNIIFVNGRPKLADIDLVTDLSTPGQASRIGTEGYMAPEGPGTASADVFSLGRILYVALSGKPPDQCPELSTRVTDHPECALLLELNPIICRACEVDLSRRYASAALMRTALLEVSNRLEKKR